MGIFTTFIIIVIWCGNDYHVHEHDHHFPTYFSFQLTHRNGLWILMWRNENWLSSLNFETHINSTGASQTIQNHAVFVGFHFTLEYISWMVLKAYWTLFFSSSLSIQSFHIFHSIFNALFRIYVLLLKKLSLGIVTRNYMYKERVKKKKTQEKLPLEVYNMKLIINIHLRNMLYEIRPLITKANISRVYSNRPKLKGPRGFIEGTDYIR